LREASDCRWATSPAHLADADLIILPGSKLPAADLAWMRARSMDVAIQRAWRANVPIIAVCGGTQMLGERIEDPHHVEHGGTVDGLGLLPIHTCLRSEKAVCQSELRFVDDLCGPFEALSGLCIGGYEIHYGDSTPTQALRVADADGSAFVSGNVLALLHHGIFEDPRVLQAVVEAVPLRDLPEIFDGLADLAEEHLDMDAISAMTLT